MVNSYNFKWSQMTLILLSQMALLRWLTQLDSWLWLSQSFSFGFIFCCNKYLLYNGFPSIGKFWSCGYISFHPFDFLSRWKMDLLFHCVASDFYCADWDGLCDHLRDVLWENFFKLGASCVPKDCSGWVQVGTDVYISQCKYQVTLFHLHVFQLLFLQS